MASSDTGALSGHCAFAVDGGDVRLGFLYGYRILDGMSLKGSWGFFVGSIVVLGLAACQTGRDHGRVVPTYIVEVTGSSDASYAGTVSIDGAVEPVSGTGRNLWTFQGDELDARFRRDSKGGLLRFEIRDKSGKHRAVATPPAAGECELLGRGGKVEARTYLKPIAPPESAMPSRF